MHLNFKALPMARAPAVALLLIAASACQRGVSVSMHEPFNLGPLRCSIESAKMESRPPSISAPPAPHHDRVYLILTYRLTNSGKTSVDVGLPPFELHTADGRRFSPDLMVSLLHPAERAEASGSLAAMADVLNSELHPGVSGTYDVAFSLPADASRQHLHLIVRHGWLGLSETIVSLN